MELSEDGQSFANPEKIELDCDCLAIAGGWTPAFICLLNQEVN